MNASIETDEEVMPGERRPAGSRRARTETLVWSGRPSQVANLGVFIGCSVFFWLVIPIFVGIWRYLLVRTMRYEVTSQRFRVTSGVLSRRIEEVELYRVKDSAFRQSLFQRLFGLGSVALVTSDATTPDAVIESISARLAKDLREQIRDLVEDLREAKRVREIDYA